MTVTAGIFLFAPQIPFNDTFPDAKAGALLIRDYLL
jgi:hypothetical protein